jgi:predicted SnoaL-like aldol condensation-catalyzing enzyme
MNLEKNKQTGMAFYKTAFDCKSEKATELHLGDKYIQKISESTASGNTIY